MAKLELLTVSLAVRALTDSGKTDKALELTDELLASVRKMPPGNKLELLTVLFAVKTLLEAGAPDKANSLIDGILDAMKKPEQDNEGE
ncbi:MAG: hypothetical protein IK990_13480 [Ruminiclostridium sp.]|nr:hypothetical protein [Ruminiclostridium sp.]